MLNVDERPAVELDGSKVSATYRFIRRSATHPGNSEPIWQWRVLDRDVRGRDLRPLRGRTIVAAKTGGMNAHLFFRA
jgi:hypothetical protein